MAVVVEVSATVDVELLSGPAGIPDRTSSSDVLRMTGFAWGSDEPESRSLALLGMTIDAALLVGDMGARASWGLERCIWSRMFWLEAAKRWVKNVEPTPIQSVITAMVTRMPISRFETSGKVRFFSTVTSPKKTRW